MKRDANEDVLVELAEQLGATWLSGPPFDGWCFNPRTVQWTPVEVKNPDGRNRYTPFQKTLMKLFMEKRIPWFVWRTGEDVMRDLGARKAA